MAPDDQHLAPPPAGDGRLCEHCSSAENVKTYDDYALGPVDLCDDCEAERD